MGFLLVLCMMEKGEEPMRRSFLGLQVMLLLCIRWVSPVTSQPGFLSIDCGSEVDYYDNTTKIHWVTDANYTSTGQNANSIDVLNASYNTPQLQTLRYFPEPRSRDCYLLPLIPQRTFLIRSSFYFGNWAGVSISSFHIFLNNTDWGNYTFGAGTQMMCMTVSGPINPLGIKPLLESPVLSNLSISSSPSASAPDRPPYKVMQDAWIDLSNVSMVQCYAEFGRPVGSVLLNSYFQELDGNASATNIRSMMYLLNGEFVQSFNVSAQPYEISHLVHNITGDVINMTFVPTTWSKLPPMLNGYEVHFFYDFDVSKTAPEDVSAISALRTRINLTTWTGDPCLPVPYDWLTCTVDDTVPTLFRVTNLSLSYQGIKGTVPPEILNLTALSDLSLSNNYLTGPIPDLSSLVHLQNLYLENNTLSGNIPSFLGSLPNLTQLNLAINNFSGTIPPEVAEKPGLTFSYLNNPNLQLSSRHSSSGPSTGTVVGGILGAMVTLAIFCMIARFFRTRKKRATPDIIRAIRSNDEKQKHGEMNILSLAGSVMFMTLQEVSNATKKFSKKIGEGSFGPVYYGTLPDGQEVAVKVKSAESNQGFYEFHNEVDLLSRIHHRNLVSLVGYCDEEVQQILVYVYVSNGTFQDHLYRDKTRKRLNWRTRLDIALNAARGLEYLHTDCTPRIIHRDVKSSNILLDENLVAKVADFGISKISPEGVFSAVDTLVKGTPGYLDPAYFTTQRLTQKSDVYSFGVVLLEIIAGRHPIVPDLQDGTSTILIEWARSSVRDGKAMDIFDASLGGEFNPESGMKVVSLAISSTDPVTPERPDMGQVVRALIEAIELELYSEIPVRSSYVHHTMVQGNNNRNEDSDSRPLYPKFEEVFNTITIVEPR